MKLAPGFAVTFVGGALAVGFSYLLRVFFGVTYLPEVAAQALFSIAPGSVESQAVENPLSGDMWVLWNLDWNPPSNGAYRLMVRATDKTGLVQTATMRNPFPDGASGYQAIDIRVSTL